MKKLICFIGCILLSAITFQSVAQEMQPLPIDPLVRYGKLANGLTYYIRHNGQTKERADFYIAQRVGSIQEDDSQAGLAHFLEHMAFNGTANFPGKAMINYLESIGVRFGENLNAYTGFDETVYMIKDVPVTRQGVVDSCMLILYDWSNGISLEEKEIDKERSVIHEEWRTRGDAQMRLWEQQLPIMYAGSKYADRLPIGKMNVVDNFAYDELRNYYKKWYRPDLQAIIIVGDVNAEKIETDLKKLFGAIPNPVNPSKRESYEVPDNEIPIVSIAKDKEASRIILFLYFKHSVFPEDLKATPMGLVENYITRVCGIMMNDRFNEMIQKPNTPFIYASGSDGNFMVAKTKDAWTVAAIAKEGEIDNALASMARETERIKQFGFTASEYERARINVLKGYESTYNEREKRSNQQYVQEYVNHFTDGGYIPGIDVEYNLINQIAPTIPVEEINRYINQIITDKNIVIALTGPDKKEIIYPTKEELLNTFMQAQKEEISAYEEKISNEPLVSNLPKPGKITSIKDDQKFGSTTVTLSNGIKVVLKKTTFKADEIILIATAPGGSILFGSKDIDNLKIFNDVTEVGGLGNFSSTDLTKMLAGKKLSSSFSLGLNERNIRSFSSPKDLETLFQLIYLQFTAPRIDNEAYESYVGRMKAQLQNLELNPMVAFSDTVSAVLHNNEPRFQRIQIKDFENINYEQIMQMYKTCFTGAGDFVFSLVGNIDLDSIKPYLEQYLAVLPKQSTMPKQAYPVNLGLRKGDYTTEFEKAMETPKAAVVNIWSGTMSYNLENSIQMRILKQILDIVYIEKVREDEGGTYGVSVYGAISYFPSGQTVLQTYFDTDPTKQKKLNQIIKDELIRISKEGPSLVAFNKTKENLAKKHAEDLQQNNYWLNVLNSYFYRNIDIESDYDSTLKNITPDDIKLFTEKIIEQGNQIEIVMEPLKP